MQPTVGQARLAMTFSSRINDDDNDAPDDVNVTSSAASLCL